MCTSLISYGISSSVRKKYAEYQYAAIRGYSANNNKVNKMLGRYVGKQYRALSKLKIGSNTKAEFIKALYKIRARSKYFGKLKSPLTFIFIILFPNV